MVTLKINEVPPHTHDLVKLLSIAKINLSEEQIDVFNTITEFNISAGYDFYRLAFYKKCNKKFTHKYLDITKQNFLWIKKSYPKK